jgi:hypothetical protein
MAPIGAGSFLDRFCKSTTIAARVTAMDMSALFQLHDAASLEMLAAATGIRHLER